jgi:hypothetical protein
MAVNMPRREKACTLIVILLRNQNIGLWFSHTALLANLINPFLIDFSAFSDVKYCSNDIVTGTS